MSKTKFFIIIFSIVLVLILGGAFTAISIASYKPTIAFYNINEKVQNIILDEMKTMNVGKKNKPVQYNIKIMDENIPLSEQKKILKKAKMVFAPIDMDVLEYSRSGKVISMEAELLEGTPSTTRGTANITDNKLYSVPLLYDFYQINVNREIFLNSGVKNINVWNDLLAFLRATVTAENQPFAFSGGDETELLNFFGCMVEATCGPEALVKAEERLYNMYKSGDSNKLITLIEEMMEDEKVFKPAADAIFTLYSEKLVSPSIFSFKPMDTQFFLGNSICNSGFLLLSQHRNLNKETINNYSSIYVPGYSQSGSRRFSAPTISVLAQSKKPYVLNTIKLLTSSSQASLSKKSGLAPILSNCSVPDKQADDVRFWLAASQGPVIPLSGAVPSLEARKLIADRIAVRCKFGL